MTKMLLVISLVAIFLSMNAFAEEAIPYDKAFPKHPENPGDMLLDSGGPDEFGYIWIDSNEPDGPVFEWVDISGIGTPISMSDDDLAGPYDLGFDFSFYGNTYNQFWVCSNGFGAVIPIPDPGGFIYYVNQPFPSPPDPGYVAGAAVAPFWDDLNPELGGGIFYYAANDSFIVSWVGIQPYGGGGAYTFELILTADGNITYQYLSMQDLITSCTVGIQNEDGTIGLQVVYNQGYVEDGLAVEIGVPATEEIVYFEDFDDGMGIWAGEWGLATNNYHSPPNSLADSPVGNYANYDTVVVETTEDIDLVGYAGYRLEFWTKYDIETGFDYIYMDISSDGGSNWNSFHVFNGEGVDWYNFIADLGGYAERGIRFRFTLETDALYTVDGMYIDDFTIFGLDTDTSPPLILHDGPTPATSVPDEFIVLANITDFSGVQTAWVSYAVDGSDLEVANIDSIVGDDYYFTIPAVEAGAHVEYFITAIDDVGNEGSTDYEHYVSGTVIFYDDGEPEFIYQYNAGDKLAVRFTPDENCILVTGLMRLYTDNAQPPHPLDTVDVEVWENGFGNLPGQSVLEPFGVWPAATLDDPQAWTYVDFRGMGLEFDDDFHFGFTYRSQYPVILGESPQVAFRSSLYQLGSWSQATTDFEMRAVVDYGMVGVDGNENQIPSRFGLMQNYPNPFNASTVLSFALNKPGHVKLNIYNLLGQHVETLVNGKLTAGEHTVTWKADDLPSGVYFARLVTKEHTESVKMMLLK